MSNKFLNMVFAGVLALGFTNIASANYGCCDKEEKSEKIGTYCHKTSGCKDNNRMHKDVVISGEGTMVRDSFGGCVRTRFDVRADKCCGKKHDKYVDITHMEERIIYFDFDKSLLREAEKGKLDILVNTIKENDIKAVKVVGYADRIGTHDYNSKLSQKRAASVKRYLDSKVKLQSNVVELRALGDSNQVKVCDDTNNRAELINCLAPNRRVEVEVDHTEHHVMKKKK